MIEKLEHKLNIKKSKDKYSVKRTNDDEQRLKEETASHILINVKSKKCGKRTFVIKPK